MPLEKMLTVHDENVDDMALDYITLRSWTPEEDERLINLVRQYGKKWSTFENLLQGRTAVSIRNRYKCLYPSIY